MDIAELYEDDRFNDTLVHLAQKKSIISFDDFRQDVFLEIIDSECTTYKQCLKAANRVAKLCGRVEYSDDIMKFAYEDENGHVESDDEVMSRLVYQGKASKVG